MTQDNECHHEWLKQFKKKTNSSAMESAEKNSHENHNYVDNNCIGHHVVWCAMN